MKFIIFGFAFIIITISLFHFSEKSDNKESLKNTKEQIKSSDSDFTTKKDSLKKIKSKDYTRYIFLKKTDTSYILNMIKEFGELSGNDEYQKHSFWIANQNEWKILKVDKSLNFYTYHNLVAWFYGYEENKNIPEISIGFAQHETDLEDSYMFYLDPNNEYGDTHIGVFNNLQAFTIYLPEAFEENGNITLNDNIELTMNSVTDYLTKEGFEFSKIKTSEFSEHQIKIYE